MIDVVYPLIDASKNRDDFELKYSLRSLAVQPWVNDVYIIGQHCPKWINTNIVKHIQCPDLYQGNKDGCIINKILRACCEQSICENIVVNSDDQYFLKIVNPLIDLLPMKEYQITDNRYKVRNNGNNWHRRVCDTIHFCQLNKLPDFVLQSHTPYLINKHLYQKEMCRVPWGKGNGFTTHIYFNLLGNDVPVEPQGRTARIKNQFPLNRIKNLVSKAMFLNHNDGGLGPGMIEFLRQNFPNPSMWEKQ